MRHSNPRTPTVSYRSLWWAILTCLAGGGVFFSLKFVLHDLGFQTLSEVALHVAIAFIVAFILLIALEFNAKRETHQEMIEYGEQVATNVFWILLKRIIPDGIFAELASLIRSSVIKRDCKYVIVLAKPSTEQAANRMTVRRTTSFVVQNLTNFRTEYVLRSEGPVHRELKVNDQTIPLIEGRNLFPKLVGGERVMSLVQPIPLGSQEEARIYLSGEETKAIEAGSNNYIQSTAVMGLSILVRNEYPERIESTDVDMLHPGRPELRRDELDSWYRFDRAVLPGQGFQITWHIKEECASVDGRREDCVAA